MSERSSLASPPDAGVRELHLESLVGHRLRGADGKSLGRIEEIVADVRGTDWIVLEVHVGPGALLERLAELTSLVPLFGALHRRLNARHRVPWDRIDFTDPSRPRATVRRAELERV
jgi:sporulation protein YlmC with PRC-barrel domain